MTHFVKRLSPPNSVLFVLDPDDGELPLDISRGLVAATSSALVIGTLAEADGVTEVHLTDERVAVPEELELAWDGALHNNGRLGIVTVPNEVVMEVAVPAAARVQVWTNDHVEPDIIWVVVKG